MSESTHQPREAWSEVGRRFEDLGRALRGHFERPREHEEGGTEAAGTQASGTETGGTGTGGAGTGDGGSAAADQAAVRGALRRLGQAAQHLGDQAGEAVRDPDVRAHAQHAARTLRDALEATFSGLGDEVRGRVRARRSGEEAPPEPPAAPEPPKEIGPHTP